MKAIIKVALPVLMAVSGVALASSSTRSDFDIQGLNQQVQSIDARTTNNEKDIKVLQDNTQTPPAEHVVVPVITATPVDPTVQSAPGVAVAPVVPEVTLIDQTFIPIPGHDTQCQIQNNWSDGTTTLGGQVFCP